VCGPALPVWSPGGSNLAVHWALDSVEPGSVLVVDAQGHLAGYWGEVLTRAALRLGVAGLVIWGGVRDVDAIEAHEFPVFATGIGIPGTGKSTQGSVGAPVTVGGVRVEPGSWIVGDRDGVIALPRAEVDRTFAAAQDRHRKESGYFDRIAAGERTLDIYGWRSTPLPTGDGAASARGATAAERSV
jgi:4-hydroxy-4-methyl-2-oxoglutarate aldolase